VHPSCGASLNFDFGGWFTLYEDTRQLATSLGINGTPGFVFKASIARGLLSLEQLKASTREVVDE